MIGGARARYLLRRISEVPAAQLLEKILGKTRPLLWWAVYRFGPQRRLEDADFEGISTRLAQLGQDVARNLACAFTRDGAYLEQARRRSSESLAGTTSILGYGACRIPAGPEWQADIIHGHAWPPSYFAAIDFVAHRSRCDVKVPWELSRLHCLNHLAEGSVLNADPSFRYADRAEQILKDWLNSNPVGYGVNWTCPMEVAIRGVNLTTASAILWPGLSASTRRRVAAALRDHRDFVSRFPEISDVPGNHYLADLMGIAVLEAVLESTGSERVGQSLERFTEQADTQFDAEGCHIERAPRYHLFCLEMVAIVTALAVRLKHPVLQRLTGVLQRGIDFCETIASDDGSLPIFGDNDSGQVLGVSIDERDYRPLKAFLVALPSAGPGEPREPGSIEYWLNGLAGTAWTPPSVPDESKMRAWPAAGRATVNSVFACLETARLKAVMRIGEKGLTGYAPHDHDDAMAVWASWRGMDVLVEKGCHSYTLDTAMRREYIVSSAHNVVRPVDHERFEPRQGSIYLTVRDGPVAHLEQHGVANGVAAVKVRLGVDYTGSQFQECRRWAALHGPQRLVVRDFWRMTEPNDACLEWFFAPGFRVRKIEASHCGFVMENDSRNLLVECHFETPDGSSLSCEETEYSCYPRYGLAVPAVSIRLRVSHRFVNSLRSDFVFFDVN